MRNYNHYSIDAEKSIKAFYSIQDTVLPKLIKGTVYSVEQSGDFIAVLLDNYSGIDLIRHDDTGLQGIAWRAQYGGHDWGTFTIRSERHTGAKTELAKRLEAIKGDGYFYPEFTMQAYFDNDVNFNCLSCAIIRTIDLLNAYQNSPSIFGRRQSDNEFVYVYWSKLKTVKVWRATPATAVKEPAQLKFFFK